MRKTTDALTVSIANQGEFIPASARKHLFEKFYQSDTSHATKGNGLGLTIVHRIMELHGGSMSPASSENG